MRAPTSVRLLAAAAATLVATSVGVAATTATATAATTPSPRFVNGWLPWWDMQDAQKGVLANGDIVGVASPFWYYTNASGAIVKKSRAAGDPALVAALKAKGITVMPSVTDGATSTQTLALLRNPTARKKQVSALVDLTVKNGFHGLDMDYEKIAFGRTADRPAMRAAYSTFIADLSKALHAKGKRLSVAVMAKTGETRSTSATYTWDYVSLGRSVDRFRIMTYDYGYSGGSAAPIAPLPWVKSVTTYAKRTMTDSKIQMGIPLYGYDWGKKGVTANSVTYPEAMALIKKYKASRKWSATNAAPYFTYRDAKKVVHTVHYMDRHAVSARMIAAKSLGVGGVTFWAFGQEDPGMWATARAVVKAPVLPAASLRWAPATVRKNTNTALIVNAGTAYAGRPASIQRYTKGKWVTIKRVTLSSKGTYSLRTKSTVTGKPVFRVWVSATYYKPAVKTPTATLTVR